MKQPWVKTVAKAATLLVSVSAALTLIYGAFHFIFFNNFTSDLAADEAIMISSQDIHNQIGDIPSNYSYDAAGNIFEYERAPSRVGYVICYTARISGRGTGEVDFALLDNSTVPPHPLTKRREPVGARADVDGAPISWSQPFFVATGKAKGAERLSVVVTLNSVTNQNAVVIKTVELPLPITAVTTSAQGCQ
jgi:hypothetical protein